MLAACFQTRQNVSLSIRAENQRLLGQERSASVRRGTVFTDTTI